MTMDMACDCGGTLKPAKLRGFDLKESLGIDAIAEQVRGLRCARCGWETLSGRAVNAAMHIVAARLVESEARLSSDLARYLRKYLGLTQEELARRMGLSRKTVNQWETGDPISPQHDLILRTLVYARLSDVLRPDADAIDHVRTSPPKRRARLIVRRLERAA